MDRYAVSERAVRAALARYGLAKTAGALDTAKRLVTAPFRSHFPAWNRPGALGAVADGAQSVADLGRSVVFGNPVDAWKHFQELRKTHGALGAYGKTLKDWYWSPSRPGATGWDRAGDWMNRASTAVDLALGAHQLATGDPDQRWGDAAAFAAGLATAPVTGQLGMFAGHRAHTAVTQFARDLGHRLDASRATTPAYQPPADRRYFAAKAARGALGGIRTPDGAEWPTAGEFPAT